MRINSRRWQASILLVLATLLATSAFGSLQLKSSTATHDRIVADNSGIVLVSGPRALDVLASVTLPGPYDQASSGDYRFDVEDSWSDWQPASVGADLTPPTGQHNQSFSRGNEAARRADPAATLLNRSAKARN